jgi:hypothetical protein
MGEVCAPAVLLPAAAADRVADEGLDDPGRGLVAVDGRAEAVALARLVSEEEVWPSLCAEFLVSVSRSSSRRAMR